MGHYANEKPYTESTKGIFVSFIDWPLIIHINMSHE